MAVGAEGGGQRNEPAGKMKLAEASGPVHSSDYVFEPIKIEPSAIGGAYTGRFRFVNHGSRPVSVSGFDEPYHGMFCPRFVGFEIKRRTSWKKLEVGYCGTGAESFDMEPGVPYEFVCDLSRFDEQGAPLTGRISVDGFVSESFVLNWKKDRANGAFAAARHRLFQEVRQGFEQAGFKRELISGDDFCARILRSIMKATDSGARDGFAKFKGDLNVTPEIEFNGNIRIDFASEDGKGSQYQGWWVINPNKFDPEWFGNASQKERLRCFKWLTEEANRA